jgi:hypothetical protein
MNMDNQSTWTWITNQYMDNQSMHRKPINLDMDNQSTHIDNQYIWT